MPCRSYLFVPGNRPERYAKACELNPVPMSSSSTWKTRSRMDRNRSRGNRSPSGCPRIDRST